MHRNRFTGRVTCLTIRTALRHHLSRRFIRFSTASIIPLEGVNPGPSLFECQISMSDVEGLFVSAGAEASFQTADRQSIERMGL